MANSTAAPPPIRLDTEAPPPIRNADNYSTAIPPAIRLDAPDSVPRAEQLRVYRGGTLTRGVSRGIEQSQGLFGQVLKSVGDLSGLDKLVEVGDELVQEAFVEAVSNPARLHGLEDIKSVGDLGEYVKQVIGEQAFNIVAMAAPGGMGALLGKLSVGKAATALVAKQAATKGAAIGAFTGALPINTGEVLQESRDAGFDPNFFGHLAVGAGSSSLEVLGLGIAGRAIFGQAKKEVVGHALSTVLARVGHTSMKSFAGEFGTEGVQEAMVLASRKIDDPTYSITDALTSREGGLRILNAAFAGGIVGGAMGGAGGATVGAAQAAQLGMQKAKARADIRPAIDALQELGKKDEGAETNSLFGGITLARRNTYKATVGRVRSSVKEWRRAKKNGGDVGAAAAAVEETVNKAYDDMSTEVDALDKVKDILTEVESATLRGINTLRNVLSNMPKATAEQRPSPRQARKVAQAVAEAKQIRDSLPKNADTTMKAENAQRTLELVSKIALNSLGDPLGVPVARLEKMLNQAEKFTVAAVAERKAELDKSQRTLEVSTRVIEREAGGKKKLPADPSTTEMATPTEETLASLKEVGENRKRATFIRGYGADLEALPPVVSTQMGRLGLKPRADVEGNRIVAVRKEDLDTPFEELEREEFPTPLAEVGEDAVTVTTRNKDGVPTKNELVPNDPAAIEEALARGTTSGTTTEARSPSAAVTESVRMSNDEADALALGLTIGQVEELADEQAVIYVRMPTSNRLMPAVVSIDETLQREDGKPFRLFDTKAAAEKAKKLKTSQKRFEDIPAENIEIVGLGAGFVIRVTLPGNRTAHKDRQVRKILRRGDSTPDKAKYTILGSKDGKEVRLHLGEVTKLGLLEEGGRGGDQLDARASFLTGLYTLAADYGYTVNFNPETQSNKVIYGNTKYKNAGPRRGTPFARKDFVDWLVDLVEEGEIEYSNLSGGLRLNLSKHIWDSGMYSPEEIAAIENSGSIIEAVGSSADEVVFPVGREGELARRVDINDKGTELPNVNNEEADPFNMQLHGESKTYNAVPDHQVRDLLSWPAAKKSVEFVLKYLNIKERVILFDEETASALIAAYQVQGTEAAEFYSAQIRDAVAADTSGRILPLPNGVADAERVVHIYVSANRPRAKNVSRNFVLLHELGHLVQYTHLDRLSPKLRQQVLDSFGHADTDTNREVFANRMIRIAVNMNKQQRYRRPARVDSIDNFFKTVVYDLRIVFRKVRHKLKYNKTFESFVEALHTHSAAQRGEKVDTLWMTPLGKKMFDELEAAGNSGYITTPRPGIAEKAPAKKSPSVKKVPQKQKTKAELEAEIDQVMEEIDAFEFNSGSTISITHPLIRKKDALESEIYFRFERKQATTPRKQNVERTIERPRFVSRKTVRENPDKVFVFGDNDQRKGLGGQAKAMRGEKNAVGVRTKKAPRRDRDSYYIDNELEENKKKIDEDFEKIWQALADGKTIVIPAAGLGTGLARTNSNKKTMAYIQQQIERLEEEAGLAEAEQLSEEGPFERAPEPDDMSLEVDAAVEQAEDSMFQNFVDNFQNWATTLKDDPIKAGKMLVYTADAELRGMGAVGTWVARQFRALPISGEQSMTVFREIMMRAAPHFTKLNRVLNDIPGARISLWESAFNKRPSAETLALRAQRKRLNQALLLQTPLNEVDADIRGHVRDIRKYLGDLYNWYTGTMGMQLGRRKDYYPLMLDTLIVDKNRAKFERILRNHGFSTRAATRERSKLTRDEDGGLNNGMQDEDVGSDFLGPGFTAKKRRANRDKWTNELRAELVEEGFYQQDIATTLIAYTEMMTRRAVWERRFHDPNRDEPTQLQKREYERRGLSIYHPVATLQLKLKKALERGDLTEWQYNRINQDILPGYAGQLGLRTNSHIRKLNAGVVIYQNLRILAFAIFSQFVDVGTMVARGDVASAQAGLRQMLDKHSREDAMEMLEAIGAMRQGLTEHILNDQALNTFMTGNAKRVNDLFFRYNMMEGWTNNMRALGLISGREFMQRNARKAASGDTQAQRYLDELDITAGEIMAWDGHSTTDMRINAALNRYIDESMIRPDPTIRPVWMSDPGYAIFAHLKGFVYGFHETFLRRVGREVSVHQNLLPLLALGMLTLPFAAVGYELRRKVLGTSKHAPEGLDYVQELVERSGMFGAFQLVVDMEQADQYGKPFALGVGGPAVEQLFDFFDRDLASWTPKAIPVVASIPAARQWVQNEMSDE